ncbi:unnamed protein product [Trichogramma brassicae]|uniref:CCHC-type domain-containing protein n=1 Tax=Trichogramma brassicae TaxID=86971 RepID=A0A6H5I4X1_9HYME|nr:unnamed protein product [Trichogramma brassicae]
MTTRQAAAAAATYAEAQILSTAPRVRQSNQSELVATELLHVLAAKRVDAYLFQSKPAISPECAATGCLGAACISATTRKNIHLVARRRRASKCQATRTRSSTPSLYGLTTSRTTSRPAKRGNSLPSADGFFSLFIGGACIAMCTTYTAASRLLRGHTLLASPPELDIFFRTRCLVPSCECGSRFCRRWQVPQLLCRLHLLPVPPTIRTRSTRDSDAWPSSLEGEAKREREALKSNITASCYFDDRREVDCVLSMRFLLRASRNSSDEESNAKKKEEKGRCGDELVEGRDDFALQPVLRLGASRLGASGPDDAAASAASRRGLRLLLLLRAVLPMLLARPQHSTLPTSPATSPKLAATFDLNFSFEIFLPRLSGPARALVPVRRAYRMRALDLYPISLTEERAKYWQRVLSLIGRPSASRGGATGVGTRGVSELRGILVLFFSLSETRLRVNEHGNGTTNNGKVRTRAQVEQFKQRMEALVRLEAPSMVWAKIRELPIQAVMEKLQQRRLSISGDEETLRVRLFRARCKALPNSNQLDVPWDPETDEEPEQDEKSLNETILQTKNHEMEIDQAQGGGAPPVPTEGVFTPQMIAVLTETIRREVGIAVAQEIAKLSRGEASADAGGTSAGLGLRSSPSRDSGLTPKIRKPPRKMPRKMVTVEDRDMEEVQETSTPWDPKTPLGLLPGRLGVNEEPSDESESDSEREPISSVQKRSWRGSKDIARKERYHRRDMLFAVDALLVGEAQVWYESVEHKLHSWQDFERRFRRSFANQATPEELLTELRRRTQGKGEDINTYLTNFRYLCSRFREPLPYENQPSGGAIRKELRCTNCKQQGHWTTNCPTIECFKCHKKGHMARACPESEDNVERKDIACQVCGQRGVTVPESAAVAATCSTVRETSRCEARGVGRRASEKSHKAKRERSCRRCAHPLVVPPGTAR